MAMPDRFKLTFYGTRGSRSVCGAQYSEFGGDTTCLCLEVGDRTLIFDSGSGLVRCGQDLMKRHFSQCAKGPLVSYIFQTHTHYDHIIGFPYFGPLYYADSTTYVYGPRNTMMSFEETVRSFIKPPYHPIPLHEMEGVVRWGEVHEPEAIFFMKDQEEPVSVNVKHSKLRQEAPEPDRVETVVRCLRGYNHPKSGVMVYRVEHAGRSVVIATDVEGYVHGDQRLIHFSRGADVLVHDAMYTEETYASMPVPTQGWGHATVDCAMAVACKADVGRVYLVHHNPNHDDERLRAIEAQAQSIFDRAVSARDGHSLDLLEHFSDSRR